MSDGLPHVLNHPIMLLTILDAPKSWQHVPSHVITPNLLKVSLTMAWLARTNSATAVIRRQPYVRDVFDALLPYVIDEEATDFFVKTHIVCLTDH